MLKNIGDRKNMSRLKAMIDAKGTTQAEIARITRIKYKTVNRICQTGIRTIRIAKKYAEALKCSPLELLEY